MQFPEMFSVQGQVAIVTGAGKGIGRACAIALAGAGADVVAAARTQADLDALAAQIEATGARCLPIACDVNDDDALTNLVERTLDAFGKITLLVNNAGGAGPNDPLKMSRADFARVLAWNVAPAYSLIQKVAGPMLEAGGGAVVNISSTAARYAQKHFSAYGAAKAALNQMTRNLAQDFAPHVRINAIEPGTIMTDALGKFLTPEREAHMVKATPMAQLGQPEDIAAAALFLCSPAARWITGKVLGVDGGVEAPNWV
ncbi:MAG TPA: glucose 1-dehydrogenase [Paraburkholderia sp.]|jgi:7-alpha-hydroxysteroid dehydrogenase|uniref:glucose 1-dehydrogenase n=1 Tax=Paraburkholderia sp. TaxID=1926495 RepID=UPI002B4698BB|nr:glucose 1-dehydrogenase [Paraburkholderia sp.]HKR43559.1 glucose 1-dehydrogenase [Paraburkholderia sp.]